MRIADFREGVDRIDVRSINVNKLEYTVDQVGDDIHFNSGNTSVIIEDTSLAGFSNDNFIF